MTSLESLREIRELEAFLGVKGGCWDHATPQEIAEERARIARINDTKRFQSQGEEVLIGMLVYDLKTRELRSYDRDDLSLYKHKKTGKVKYLPRDENPEKKGWVRFDALMRVSAQKF